MLANGSLFPRKQIWHAWAVLDANTPDWADMPQDCMVWVVFQTTSNLKARERKRTEFISRVYQSVLDESTLWYLRVAWCGVGRRASCADNGVPKQHPCCRAWGLGRCSSTQRAPRGAEHMFPEPNDSHLPWVTLCSRNALVKCSSSVLDVEGR